MSSGEYDSENSIARMQAKHAVEGDYEAARAFLGITAAEIRADTRIRLLREQYVNNRITFGMLVEAIMVVATEPRRHAR